MDDKLSGYAGWMVEHARVQLGYDAKDSSHDDEVLNKLQEGSKMSKSKMQGGVKNE